VGAFVKARREEMGLSQGDIIQALGYASRNAVSNIEVGIEGLPAKRIYAWADILEVPRDAFFRFATGEATNMAAALKGSRDGEHDGVTSAERSLLEAYRKLPSKYQRRLREQAEEYATIARAMAARR
jgi:transcriptional regulator with XRE-family HTH domain